MMTFVNDNGEVLEVEGDIFLTKRAVSFFNSKILGDYSVNFNVDNNSQTRKVLNYDGPQMLNQVAFTRQPFTLMRNGNPFVRGNIIIQQDNGVTLSCFFLSGNSNWINLLNNLITELDFTGVTNGTNYEFQWNKTNVLIKMASNSGVVFPMVDWCYRLNKGNNAWYVANLLDGLKDANQTYCEFYPCFYIKTLIQEIATQAGIKIVGTLMDDALYNSLALTPAAGEMKREHINVTSANGSAVQTLTLSDPAGYNQYTLLIRTSDPENRFSASQYTAGRSSKLLVTVNLITVTGTGTSPVGQLAIMKNGIPIYEEFIFASSSMGIRSTITTVNSGDIISLSFKLSVGAPTTLTLGIQANIKIEIPTILTVDDFIRPNYFLPALAQIDILKFIINYFGCVCSFDDFSKTLTINVVEKMPMENASDWSDYFVSFRSNYIIEPGANNYVRLQESEEYELKAYDKTNVIKFGEGSIPTNNQLKEQNNLFILPFGASWFQSAKNSDWLTMIPLVSLRDMESILYTSVTYIGGPEASYQYPYPSPDDGTGYLFAQGQAVRVVDDVRGDIGIHIVKTFTGGAVEFWRVPFIGNSTGRLYPQERTFNEINPRILSVIPSVAFSDVSINETSYELFESSNGPVTTEIAIASGIFCKNETGEPIDLIKTNLAFDNPAINGFNDPSVKNIYFGKIAQMLNTPTITFTLILPESVFQAFAFDRFIFIKTPQLTGYFFVKAISNYRDSNSPVEVELYML